MAAKRRQLEPGEGLEPIANERIKLSDEAAELLKNAPSYTMEELEKMCEPKEEKTEKEKTEDKIMNNKTNETTGKVQKLTEEINELVTWAMKQAITSKTFLNMSDEDMICMRKVMVIFNDALDIANAYRDYCYSLEAKVDNLEKKLDKVLEKLDEK